MKKHLLYVLVLLQLSIVGKGYSQGLRFYGNEKRIAERSSFRVFTDECIPASTGQFDISFEYATNNINSPGQSNAAIWQIHKRIPKINGRRNSLLSPMFRHWKYKPYSSHHYRCKPILPTAFPADSCLLSDIYFVSFLHIIYESLFRKGESQQAPRFIYN